MAFLTWLALAAAVLVVIPYAAHRLRRRRADELPFPPTRLVPPAPPEARRRARVEDRALLATRSAGVLGLALLGATPFVRCSRLSLQRSDGASIAMAVVVDDSMSMRARGSAGTRFEEARRGALDLLGSAREGDAVAVVLAGAPARVALAPTTDLAAARQTLGALVQSDRGTDLEAALTIARGLLGELAQEDRRVVLLSDLADGHPDAPPLGSESSVPLWAPLAPFTGKAQDCAVVRAEQRGARVEATVACGPGGGAASRDVVAEDASGHELGRVSMAGVASGHVTIVLGPGDARPARARLLGDDAIAVDDVAPITAAEARGTIAVVDDADELVATGGAPVVEQALRALRLDVDVAPMPVLPDRVDDLSALLGVLLDDPPGFTPEQRRALATYLNRGGLVLLALGPRAAQAPLGASLQPVLSHAVTFAGTRMEIDLAGTQESWSESATSLSDLEAHRRANLAPEDAALFTPMVSWTDGAWLVGRRAVGKGTAWVVTLPFSVDASDLPLRPAFLSLLDDWVRAARARIVPSRSLPGVPWSFPFAPEPVSIDGPEGAVPVHVVDGFPRAVPALVGAYLVRTGEQRETRVVAPDPSECDLRPRAVAPSAARPGLGDTHARVDVSGLVALALLALMAVEMTLRLASTRARPVTAARTLA